MRWARLDTQISLEGGHLDLEWRHGIFFERVRDFEILVKLALLMVRVRPSLACLRNLHLPAGACRCEASRAHHKAKNAWLGLPKLSLVCDMTATWSCRSGAFCQEPLLGSPSQDHPGKKRPTCWTTSGMCWYAHSLQCFMVNGPPTSRLRAVIWTLSGDMECSARELSVHIEICI